MAFSKEYALQIALIDLAKKPGREVLGWLWDEAYEAGREDGGDAGYHAAKQELSPW